MKSLRLYAWLLGINFFISTFTFGGGYVVVPMIEKYFVKKHHYFSEEELLDMSAISQSTPGAIAINLSALAGYRTAGWGGLLISCLGSLLPPLIILSIVSIWYSFFAANPIVHSVLQGMQAGVAALIVDLIIHMCQLIMQKRSLFLTLLIPCSFLASFFLEWNVALILILCCILCVIRVWLLSRNTSDSGSGGEPKPVDQPADLHRHHHHLPDDSRSSGSQHLHLRRHPDRRNPWRRGRHSGMRPRRSPPLQPFVSVFPEISAVPLYLRSIKRTEIRLSGSDRIGSGHYSFAGILPCVFHKGTALGQRYFHYKLDLFRQLDIRHPVFPLSVCPSKVEMESHPAHGIDRSRRLCLGHVSSANPD